MNKCKCDLLIYSPRRFTGPAFKPLESASAFQTVLLLALTSFKRTVHFHYGFCSRSSEGFVASPTYGFFHFISCSSCGVCCHFHPVLLHIELAQIWSAIACFSGRWCKSNDVTLVERSGFSRLWLVWVNFTHLCLICFNIDVDLTPDFHCLNRCKFIFFYQSVHGLIHWHSACRMALWYSFPLASAYKYNCLGSVCNPSTAIIPL